MSQRTKRLTYAGVCLALCLLLPLLIGNIPALGIAALPMHPPVLLCGFLCGWGYGLLVGFVAPLLRYLLFGMPPLFPMGVAMAFELAAYGAVSGLLYRMLPKKIVNLYVALGVAMLAGRAVWGVAQLLLNRLAGSAFTWEMFALGAFANALPGIVFQIIALPIAVFLLQRKQLMLYD